MRLNELDGFVTDALIMVKFTNKERVQGFLNGKIYMNNFGYFIDQEKRERKKGQGDQYEGAHVIETNKVKAYDLATGMLMFTAETGNIVERYPEVKEIPMFCLTVFAAKDFKVISHGESSVRFVLDIPEEEKKSLKNDFKEADSAVITFNPRSFIERIKGDLTEKNIPVLSGKVEYHDFSILDRERKKSFDEGELNFLFSKHQSLSHQREFRFVLPNERNRGPNIYNVDSINDLFETMEIDQFLGNTEIEIFFKKNNPNE